MSHFFARTLVMMSNSQIDKLGRDLRSGQINAENLKRLELFRAEFGEAYKAVEDLFVNKLKLRITGRPSKSTVAIVEKLKRETIRLSQIQDIAGCRVLVPDIGAQDRLVHVLDTMLGRVVIDDKRDVPTHGYRAVHVIALHGNRPVEVQVRTFHQHAWAEISEKLADIFGQSIKYGAGEPWVLKFLSELSDLTAKLEGVILQGNTVGSGEKFSRRMDIRARLIRKEKGFIEEIQRLFDRAKNRVEG